MERRYSAQLLILLAMAMLLSGCARFPASGQQTSIRELSLSATFNGPIDDNAYYFVPIDITGGVIGPTPVFPNPDGSSGEEWVAGSATHYIVYHAHDFTIYKIINLHPFNSQPIGRPVRYTLPQSGANNLSFTIDLNSLGATASSINLNIITMNQLTPDGRLLDGLGPRGSNFVNLDITSSRAFRNQELIAPEAADDVLDQNGVVQPSSDRTKSIDIVDWTVVTNI